MPAPKRASSPSTAQAGCGGFAGDGVGGGGPVLVFICIFFFMRVSLYSGGSGSKTGCDTVRAAKIRGVYHAGLS